MPKSTIITLTTCVLVCALWIIMHSMPTVEAANPANGTISPTGPNVVWQGPVVSQDGNGAPGTQEVGSIDPSSTGTGVYLVRLVSFSVTPGDPYTGTASVGPEPPGRKANYVKDGITFSPNVTVKAPVSRRNGEPSNRTDKFGNHYTSSIRGVPAGVDLWYFDLRPGSPTYDPFMRNPIYRGQPDSFTQQSATSLGADGGGDVDLAVGFDTNDPNAPPVLAYSSLVAANVSTGKSTNRGETFQLNPIGNVTGGIPVDDRQVSFDPTGAAIISYTDDHNDYDGHTYVTRQISGGSINNEGTTNVPAPVEGASLPPRPVPAADAPQVTDFAQDIQVGLLAVLPLNDPLDILSVKYSCETTLGGPVIVAKSNSESNRDWRRS